MAAKGKNYLLLILVFCTSIATEMLLTGCNGKKNLALQLVGQLESYKSKHGLYPLNLISAGINTDEEKIFYRPDSTKHFFILGYSEGPMDVNTISYDSRTKKWEKRFNY